MQSLKCKHCGAELSFAEDNTEYVFCQYCGSKQLLDDRRTTHREVRVDEAKVIHEKTEQMVKLKQLEWEEQDRAEKAAEKNREYHEKRLKLAFDQQMEKQKLIIKIVSVAAIIIFIILGFFFIKDKATEMIGSILFMGGIALAIFVIVYLPQKLAQREVIKKGGILFPTGLEPINEKNYQAVKTTLKQLGFKNISEINKHDVLLGIFNKPDLIESVMINGENAVPGKAYLPDAPIVITYHGR